MGGGEGEKSGSHWDRGSEPSCPPQPQQAPEDLVAAVATALPLTAVQVADTDFLGGREVGSDSLCH